MHILTSSFNTFAQGMWTYGGHFQLHIHFHMLDQIGNNFIWLAFTKQEY